MVRIFVCGDVINHTSGLNFVGDDLVQEIQKADFSVCNFEGPELLNGQTAGCPHQVEGTAAYLRSIGFNLMLLANNHITELGLDGVKNSIEVIKKTKAKSIGAGLTFDDAYRPLVEVIGGKKIGFFNVCEAQVGQFLTNDQTYGYAWMGYRGLKNDIQKLSEQVDVVIVFVHAGLEHYPIPLPEIRELYRELCDAGASIIVGGHTHSAQGYEYYGEKLIIYSLGNFYYPHIDGSRPEENTSYSINILVDDKEVIKVEPIHHHLYNGKVELLKDEEKQIDLQMLNGLLQNDYDQHVNKMCVSAWDSVCSHLLAEAMCGHYEETSFFRWCKQCFRYGLFYKRLFINTQKRRDALILRLFENETYRWTITRALKIKTK